MDERQTPPTRNSSRTLAKVAVAVLVVIAIAGIVLATLRGRGTPAGAPAAADATQSAASAMTAELSDPATLKLIRFAADATKVKRGMIVVAGKSVAGSNKMDLARKRTEVVRDVLVAHGVPMREIQLKISEVPFALDSESEVNRVDFSVP